MQHYIAGNADAIGELLEKDYRNLWEYQDSFVAGLAKAENAELERLNKEKKFHTLLMLSIKKPEKKLK